MKCNVMFARFPFGNSEAPSSVNWLMRTILKAKTDPRVAEVFMTEIDDTPITVSRNRAVEQAKGVGADFLVMLDSDMKPDLYVGEDPEAKPFWDVAMDFALNHPGPCVVGAPYCGPPPHENVFVFRVGNFESDSPNKNWSVAQYGREEAAEMRGIQPCAALPTGVILIDMRAFSVLKPPYFEYEYDPLHSKKYSTEDVYFSRNLALAGVPQYCAWDSWAGHWKRKCVGKPVPTYIEDVAANLREAIVNNRSIADRVVTVRRPPLLTASDALPEESEVPTSPGMP